MMKQKIVVVGEGAWGTALAILFARNGHAVTLWCYHKEIATEIMMYRTNMLYMPDVTIPSEIIATNDIAEAFAGASWICEALPVQHLRSIIKLIRPYVAHDTPWLITSKGMEQESLLLPAEIVAQELGYQPSFGVCMGPTFARDVIEGKKSGIMIAAESDALQKQIAALFKNDALQCDLSADTLGLQICGAFKNVIAFLVGISDGAGNGDNGRALLVTRSFQKMLDLVLAAGGTLKTVCGLGGFGDLFLTASSTQSRNYSVGKAVGAGEPLQAVLERTGFTPEGVNTARSIIAYAKKYNVDLKDLMSY